MMMAMIAVNDVSYCLEAAIQSMVKQSDDIPFQWILHQTMSILNQLSLLSERA